MKSSEWAFDRIKEAFELVAQDEAEKMNIVQEIMLRSTDHLRRIIAPVGGQGGVTMSYDGVLYARSDVAHTDPSSAVVACDICHTFFASGQTDLNCVCMEDDRRLWCALEQSTAHLYFCPTVPYLSAPSCSFHSRSLQSMPPPSPHTFQSHRLESDSMFQMVE